MSTAQPDCLLCQLRREILGDLRRQARLADLLVTVGPSGTELAHRVTVYMGGLRTDVANLREHT